MHGGANSRILLGGADWIRTSAGGMAPGSLQKSWLRPTCLRHQMEDEAAPGFEPGYLPLRRKRLDHSATPPHSPALFYPRRAASTAWWGFPSQGLLILRRWACRKAWLTPSVSAISATEVPGMN